MGARPGLVALALGSAEGNWREMAAAAELAQAAGRSIDIIVAVNKAGRDYPGELTAWASFHGELFPKWIRERKAAGLPAHACPMYTAPSRGRIAGLDLLTVDNWGGSSGLLAVTVCLSLGASRVMGCGVPLDKEAAHFDDPAPWGDAGNYRRAWLNRVDEMAGRVRSFSGWTRQVLGAPTEAWLAER